MRAPRLVIAAAAVICFTAGCAADGQQGSTLPTGMAASGDEQAVVVYVVDGDTFDVERSSGSTERVRLPQVDAPEMDECGYTASSAALDELIGDATVQLLRTESGPDRDGHGRLLRAARVAGEDVGRLLVRDGFARREPQYADEDPHLAQIYGQAEQRAREEGTGLWSACDW